MICLQEEMKQSKTKALLNHKKYVCLSLNIFFLSQIFLFVLVEGEKKEEAKKVRLFARRWYLCLKSL